MIPIFKCLDGTHIDLDKIIAIRCSNLDKDDRYTKERYIIVDAQLRDNPVLITLYAKQDGEKTDEVDYDGRLILNEDKFPVFFARVKATYEELLQAWQSYKASQ